MLLHERLFRTFQVIRAPWLGAFVQHLYDSVGPLLATLAASFLTSSYSSNRVHWQLSRILIVCHDLFEEPSYTWISMIFLHQNKDVDFRATLTIQRTVKCEFGTVSCLLILENWLSSWDSKDA